MPSRIRAELTAFLLRVACRLLLLLLLLPSYVRIETYVKGKVILRVYVYFMVISPHRLYFSSYRGKDWRRLEDLGNPSSKTDDDAFPLFR